MKKTITVNRFYVIAGMISLILAFLTVFLINHTGKFSYYGNSDGGWIVMDKAVLNLIYSPPLGEVINDQNSGITPNDMRYEGKFHTYPCRVYYYWQATLSSTKYILILFIIYFSIAIFFYKFKIKIR